ncbi:MAG: response regulator [Bacteroidota bacterium]|jgi:DNA-binding NtrC family response regulator
MNTTQLQADPSHGLPQRTILVIDNNAMSLLLTKEVLQFNNYSIRTARSSAEVAEIVSNAAGSIRLALCDAGALLNDPVNIVEQIRVSFPDLTIIVSASMVEMKKIGGLIEQFSVEILLKPYNGRMLLDFVKSCL